jgi:hypothetical protein
LTLKKRLSCFVFKMLQSVFEYALGLDDSQHCADLSTYSGDYFGVFAGVTRSPAHAIAQWPQNIHGSIGYWDRDFKPVEPAALCVHTHHVAREAVTADDRRKFFPDLLTDPGAVLDVKFMCLPIRDIDPRTGMFADGLLFDNEQWGLLVQRNSGGGATFLPGVYKHTAWDAIKNHVLSKANLESDEHARFYAYRTKRCATPLCRIYDRASHLKLLSKIGCSFIRFVNSCARVPYAVTETVEYDDTQDVRNIAALLDIHRLSAILPCRARDFSAELQHYVRKYAQQPALMQQASAFLLPLLQEVKQQPELQKVIADCLERDLANMEPAFQLGESLVALKKKLPMRPAESLFELNWQAQAWPRQIMRPRLRAYANQFNPRTETNYLAVAFEAACALRMLSLSRELFCTLMQRYDSSRGLFKFLDGSARIDIACHVHSGLLSLVKMN